MTFALVAVIVIALIFDYTNGFHDAANSIATVVSTRVLTPKRAVAWAAFWNFVAFVVFKTKVADTIAKGIVTPKSGALTIGVVFAGLIGAIGWNLLTFWLGLPTSSSHALVGGVAGAAVARAGFHVLLLKKVREIASFIVLAPLIGLALGLLVTLLILWLFQRVRRLRALNAGFRIGQLASSA